MSLEHYFRDELAFLRLQGREFADSYPELTRFLSEQNTDPDVERLLEGFAFLTGNLRAKIEDEFPELTHGLLNMLWPNYLRPVPSMTIMQFSVIPGCHCPTGTGQAGLPAGQSANRRRDLPFSDLSRCLGLSGRNAPDNGAKWQ